MSPGCLAWLCLLYMSKREDEGAGFSKEKATPLASYWANTLILKSLSEFQWKTSFPFLKGSSTIIWCLIKKQTIWKCSGKAASRQSHSHCLLINRSHWRAVAPPQSLERCQSAALIAGDFSKKWQMLPFIWRGWENQQLPEHYTLLWQPLVFWVRGQVPLPEKKSSSLRCVGTCGQPCSLPSRGWVCVTAAPAKG